MNAQTPKAEYDAKVMYEQDGTMHVVIKEAFEEEDEETKYMDVTVFDLTISRDEGAFMNVHTMQLEQPKDRLEFFN